MLYRSRHFCPVCQNNDPRCKSGRRTTKTGKPILWCYRGSDLKFGDTMGEYRFIGNLAEGLGGQFIHEKDWINPRFHDRYKKADRTFANFTAPASFRKLINHERGAFKETEADQADRKQRLNDSLETAIEIQQWTPAQRDSAFRAIAAYKGLNEDHRVELMARGLTLRYMEERGFFSGKAGDRIPSQLPLTLYEDGKEHLIKIGVGLPGIQDDPKTNQLYFDVRGGENKGKTGLYIPIYDEWDRIVGYQFKPDQVGANGGKYLWPPQYVDRNGVSHKTLHVEGQLPLNVIFGRHQQPSDLIENGHLLVQLVDGNLKAHSVHQKTGQITIAMPGAAYASYQERIEDVLGQFIRGYKRYGLTNLTVVVFPDAGDIGNKHGIGRRIYQLTSFLDGWEIENVPITSGVAFWGQYKKEWFPEGGDYDDVLQRKTITEAKILTPSEWFDRLTKEDKKIILRDETPTQGFNTSSRPFARNEFLHNRYAPETLKSDQSHIHFFAPGDRIKQIAELTGYKYILDVSQTGSGKSHSIGDLAQQSNRQLLADGLDCLEQELRINLVTSDPFNPTVDAIQHGYELKRGRDLGRYAIERDGQIHYRAVRAGMNVADLDIQIESNCRFADVFQVLGEKNLTDGMHKVCAGCPHSSECKETSGDGFGYKAQMTQASHALNQRSTYHGAIDTESQTPTVILIDEKVSLPQVNPISAGLTDYAQLLQRYQRRLDVNRFPEEFIEELSWGLKTLNDIIMTLLALPPDDYDYDPLKVISYCQNLIPALKDPLPPLSDELTEFLLIKASSLFDDAPEVDGLSQFYFRPTSHSGKVQGMTQLPPNYLVDLYQCFTDQDKNGWTHWPSVSKRQNDSFRIHIHTVEKSFFRFIRQDNVQKVCLFDATISRFEFAKILGCDESEIAVICQTDPTPDNLTVKTVVGIGTNSLTSENSKKAEAFISTIIDTNQWTPEDVGIYTSKARAPQLTQALKKTTNHTFTPNHHFSDSRGRNNFQEKTVVIQDGVPRRSRIALQIEFSRIHGYLPAVEYQKGVLRIFPADISPAEVQRHARNPFHKYAAFAQKGTHNEEFDLYVQWDAWTEEIQTMGRLRATRRPDEKLTYIRLTETPVQGQSMILVPFEIISEKHRNELAKHNPNHKIYEALKIIYDKSDLNELRVGSYLLNINPRKGCPNQKEIAEHTGLSTSVVGRTHVYENYCIQCNYSNEFAMPDEPQEVTFFDRWRVGIIEFLSGVTATIEIRSTEGFYEFLTRPLCYIDSLKKWVTKTWAHLMRSPDDPDRQKRVLNSSIASVNRQMNLHVSPNSPRQVQQIGEYNGDRDVQERKEGDSPAIFSLNSVERQKFDGKKTIEPSEIDSSNIHKLGRVNIQRIYESVEPDHPVKQVIQNYIQKVRQDRKDAVPQFQKTSFVDLFFNNLPLKLNTKTSATI